MLKTKIIHTQTYYFLVIVPHFTITYAIEVIYTYCICKGT